MHGPRWEQMAARRWNGLGGPDMGLAGSWRASEVTGEAGNHDFM